MSWSISFEIEQGQDANIIALEKFNDIVSVQEQNGTKSEAYRSLVTAAYSAYGMLNSLGNEWKTASVNITGHNNPVNVFREGWANEFVTVSVSIKEYK